MNRGWKDEELERAGMEKGLVDGGMKTGEWKRKTESIRGKGRAKDENSVIRGCECMSDLLSG